MGFYDENLNPISKLVVNGYSIEKVDGGTDSHLWGCIKARNKYGEGVCFNIGKDTKLIKWKWLYISTPMIINLQWSNLEEHKRKYTNKSVKKTLSIPAWLNTLAEKENVNFSQILQNALKDYLKIDDKKNLHDINI